MYTSEYTIIIHMYDILSWLFIYIMGCDWSGNLLLNIFVFLLMQLLLNNNFEFFVIEKKNKVLGLVQNNIFFVS